MERKVFQIEVEDPIEYNEGNGDDEITIPLKKMIARLESRLNDIPEEFRDGAFLKIRGHGEYVSVYLDVYYDKPETDEEMAARQRSDEEREQTRKRALEQSERTQYERLKRKFGS